ncbi:MAG TPA: SprT-like domain-containing protein [Anaerolineales bacterium]|nr:SprT-like domain-containing protein [Anaerolineales bacterium]
MKTRTKVAITIILALLYWAVSQSLLNSSRHAPATGMTTTQLHAQYEQDNERFFNNRLPKNTIIDYGETDPQYMATTSLAGNTFRISFNPVYAKSERLDEYLLFHEACHIVTWRHGVDHGPEWRTCMLKIDVQGGFREIFIDGYQEKMP